MDMTLRQLIAKRAVTQASLAAVVRLSRAAVCLMASGLRQPSPSVAARLGKALRAQPVAIAGGFRWLPDDDRLTNAEYWSPFDRVSAIRERAKFFMEHGRLTATVALDDDDRDVIREVSERCRVYMRSPYIRALLRLAETDEV